MSISKEISNGIHLNNKNPRHLIALTIKSLIFLIPGVILGHYIDQYVNKMKREQILGEDVILYIVVQTIISILVVYFLVNWAKSYTREIENKIAGVFFASLYFNMQTHYIDNIQQLLGIL